MRGGLAPVVDELDARLHPRLAGYPIKLFQEPATNERGAQLIFNSHDPTALGSYAPARHHRDQVWFTVRRMTAERRGRRHDALGAVHFTIVGDRIAAIEIYEQDQDQANQFWGHDT